MKFIYQYFTASLCLLLALFLQGCGRGDHECPYNMYLSPDADRKNGDTRIFSAGTYNLKGLNNPKGLAKTLEALSFVDIWAFQEVNKTIEGEPDKIAFVECDLPDQLLDYFSPNRWNAFYVPMNRIGSGKEWEGMAIVSKYPILESGIWPLHATGTKQRGALYSIISVDDKNRVLIINTDHDVGFLSVTPLDRHKQVEDICNHIRDSKYAHLSIAILGDFNTMGYPLMPFRMTAREEISELRNSLESRGMCSLPGSDKPCNTFRKTMISRPLDHIFTRELRCIQWGTTKGYVGSDHRPLWMIARTNKK